MVLVYMMKQSSHFHLNLFKQNMFKIIPLFPKQFVLNKSLEFSDYFENSKLYLQIIAYYFNL